DELGGSSPPHRVLQVSRRRASRKRPGDPRRQRRGLRQPRSRGHLDPQLSLAARPGPGRVEVQHLEAKLAQAPVIRVPGITMEGDANGAPHPDPKAYASKFTGRYEHRLIEGGIGHNFPQEALQAFAQAIVDVDEFQGRTSMRSNVIRLP